MVMNLYLLAIVQSIALPFGLSGLLLYSGLRKDVQRVIGNVLIWLAAYAWIIHWPNLPPTEAVDWLWLLPVTSVVAGYIACDRTRCFARSTALLVITIAIAWPILHYQPSFTLVSELMVFIVAGTVLFGRTEHKPTVAPALAFTIQATGLAIASALSGSLLLGQLSAALAALTGAYAVHELAGRLHKTRFSSRQQLALLPLYLGLLAIARLYAELTLPATALLLSAPVLYALFPWRYGWVTCLLLNAGAIAVESSNYSATA